MDCVPFRLRASACMKIIMPGNGGRAAALIEHADAGHGAS